MSRLSLDVDASVLCIDCGSSYVECEGASMNLGMFAVLLRCRECRGRFSALVMEDDRRITFKVVRRVA